MSSKSLAGDLILPKFPHDLKTSTMYRSDHKTTTLPRSLREEIGIEGTHAIRLEGKDQL